MMTTDEWGRKRGEGMCMCNRGKISKLWTVSNFRFSQRRVWRRTTFWAIAPYSLIEAGRSFRGLHCLHRRPDNRGSTLTILLFCKWLCQFWRVVPCRSQLVAGLSPRRYGFVFRSVLVRFVMGQVASGHVFLRVLPVFPVIAGRSSETWSHTVDMNNMHPPFSMRKYNPNQKCYRHFRFSSLALAVVTSITLHTFACVFVKRG
jgi:hypothetical protein